MFNTNILKWRKIGHILLIIVTLWCTYLFYLNVQSTQALSEYEQENVQLKVQLNDYYSKFEIEKIAETEKVIESIFIMKTQVADLREKRDELLWTIKNPPLHLQQPERYWKTEMVDWRYNAYVIDYLSWSSVE